MKRKRVSRAQQLANIREALFNMWPTVPPKNVVSRLCIWRAWLTRSQVTEDPTAPPTCKTLACFGGWCAWWPAFVEQGLKVSLDGSPTFNGMDATGTAEEFFGDDRIFNARGDHPADWGVRQRHLTEHKIVENRLIWLLQRKDPSRAAKKARP